MSDQVATNTGKASFIIVTNQMPSPKLARQIRRNELPSDVTFLSPASLVQDTSKSYPPAWKNISEAVIWCVSRAEQLPYLMISPESLVWKLAGQIQLACAGNSLNPNHSFHTCELPKLFEQLLHQLQDFPSPPDPYRPQVNEPSIDLKKSLRIICGFSGSGKTAWASEAARHSSETIAYYNVGELPGPALAATLVRELTPRLVSNNSDTVRQILQPGATGLDSLAILNFYLKSSGTAPIIVLDNAHRIPAENLRSVISSGSRIRFILLCQPVPELREIEAQLGVEREALSGWNFDTVASIAQSYNCIGTVSALSKLVRLTGGIPLYVESCLRLSISQTSGDLDKFCDELDSLTHTVETAQEIILDRLFQSMHPLAKEVLAVWSLCDEPLHLSEILDFVGGALDIEKTIVNETLRKLSASGVIEVFAGNKSKVHDAIRIVGRRTLTDMGGDVFLKSQRVLKNILIKSLVEKRDASKFSLFIRTLVALGDIELLVQLAGEEHFHEMGISNEIKAYLIPVSESPQIDPRQRFWALDGLSFDATHHGRIRTIGSYLDKMKELIDTYELGTDEKLSYMMKRMLYEATNRNIENVMQLISRASIELPDKPAHVRVFKYNVAASLMELGNHNSAIKLLEEVIPEYFDLIGITFDAMIGKNSLLIWPKINRYPELHEDLKRLATTLMLLADNSSYASRINIKVQCLKLYEMAQAHDSFIKAAQDLADDFVGNKDFFTAKEVMEKHVIPNISKLGLLNRLVDARSQYAVILAYCKDFSGADKEMKQLKDFVPGESIEMKEQIARQIKLIRKIQKTYKKSDRI